MKELNERINNLVKEIMVQLGIMDPEEAAAIINETLNRENVRFGLYDEIAETYGSR